MNGRIAATSLYCHLVHPLFVHGGTWRTEHHTGKRARNNNHLAGLIRPNRPLLGPPERRRHRRLHLAQWAIWGRAPRTMHAKWPFIVTRVLNMP